MASTHSSFEVLPAEIIKRIASHLDCVSALRLSSLNRRLQHMVYERLVFQSIIERQEASYHPDDGSECSLPWITQIILPSMFTTSHPARTWAHFTLASHKATELLTRNSSADETNPPNGSAIDNRVDWRKLINYTPQLLALHSVYLTCDDFLNAIISLLPGSSSPTLSNEFPEQGVPSLTDLPQPTKDQVYALDFSLTLLALQHGVSLLHASPTGTPASNLYKLKGMKKRLILHHTGEEPRMHNGPHGPFMSVFILSLVQRFMSRQARGKAPPIIWPPTARDIPFAEFMNLPLPFDENFNAVASDEDEGLGMGSVFGRTLRTCHIKKMCRPDFLIEGTWTAYYSLSLDLESVHHPPYFQPPTLDIQFSTPPPPSGSSVLSNLPLLPPSLPLTRPEQPPPPPPLHQLVATGTDYSLFATGAEFGGHLSARGTMTWDGKMQMQERNYIGKVYHWDLEMTPLGLFGTWGNFPDGIAARGYMWLFKTAWGSRSR